MSPYKSVADTLAKQAVDQRQSAAVVDDMTKLLASLRTIVCDMDVNSAIKLVVEPRDLYVLMNNQFKQFKYALHALMLVLIAEDSKKILKKMGLDQLMVLKNLILSARKCRQINVDTATMQAMQTMDADRRELAKQIALLWDDIDQALYEWSVNIDGVYAEKKLKRQKQESAKRKAQKRMKEIYAGETITMDELRQILGFACSATLCAKINNFLKRFPERKSEVDNWFVVKGKNRKAFKVEFLDVCKQTLQKKSAREVVKTDATTTKLDIKFIDIVPAKKLDNKASIVALQKILDRLLNAYEALCQYPERAKEVRKQIDEANELLHKDACAKNALNKAQVAWNDAENMLKDVTKQIDVFVRRYSV